MVVQNNPAPWVMLAVAVMGGCLVMGMLLGGVGPFNSEIAAERMEITQTQAAINSYATQSAVEMAQTQQAPLAQQTAVVAQMTMVPLQQTATRAAEVDGLQASQLGATQTAIAGDTVNKQLADQATQTALALKQEIGALSVASTATAMAQGQAREQTSTTAGFVVGGIVVLTFCSWIIARMIIQTFYARAQVKMAQAQFLAEQRRMLSLRASLQNRNGHKPSHPIPNSLVKDVSDVEKLPRAK
jgi:hypothetical protein